MADEARTRDDGQAIADLWSALVASSEDAILTKDLDGTISSWNAGAQRLYGYSPDEAIGRNVEMLLVEGAEEEDAILDVLKGDRRIEPFETRRRRRDGSLVDVSVSISPVHDRNGRVVGGAAIARDITDLKAREAALMRSELRYRTLASQLPDAAVYEYDCDLRIVTAGGPLLKQARWRRRGPRGSRRPRTHAVGRRRRSALSDGTDRRGAEVRV